MLFCVYLHLIHGTTLTTKFWEQSICDVDHLDWVVLVIYEANDLYVVHVHSNFVCGVVVKPVREWEDRGACHLSLFLFFSLLQVSIFPGDDPYIILNWWNNTYVKFHRIINIVGWNMKNMKHILQIYLKTSIFFITWLILINFNILAIICYGLFYSLMLVMKTRSNRNLFY